MGDNLDLALIGKELRRQSEKWFPIVHGPDAVIPIAVHYTVGLVGEAGEIANKVKKWCRYGMDSSHYPDDLEEELADVFCYLLLLADELGIDMAEAFQKKVAVNKERWGDGRQ